MRIKTAILISGRGSNMDALVKASKSPCYPARIDLVISNKPNAAGLDKARAKNIDAICIDHTYYKSRRSFERAMHKALKAADIELICCAGFMRVLTPWFTSRWEGRLLNIHPSLLPKYKGLNTHQRALDAGDTEHGCTVHFVTAELDSGDIVLQDCIKITPDDDADTLAVKLLVREQHLYPKALLQVAKSLKGG